MTPHLTVGGAAAAIDFCKKAFGAIELGRMPDSDKVFAQAVAAGATVALPIADMFWGDRYGIVTDPFGHRWSIATKKKDMSPEDMAAAGKAAMAAMAKPAKKQ